MRGAHRRGKDYGTPVPIDVEDVTANDDGAVRIDVQRVCRVGHSAQNNNLDAADTEGRVKGAVREIAHHHRILSGRARGAAIAPPRDDDFTVGKHLQP